MTAATETFGLHLMIDGYGADAERLANKAGLTILLRELPELLGMHAIAAPQVLEVGPKNRKDPGGVSGFVLIAESHLSFHTFPSRRFVTLDVYTCQDSLDADRIVALMQDYFCFESHDVFLQRRGLRYPTNDLIWRADCSSKDVSEPPTAAPTHEESCSQASVSSTRNLTIGDREKR
ncbi:S-adenosylmethionine decarboxylase family protein [Roseobacter sinensis]|uniref:S-adenosylmethionine decarboxylase n=1 Tax=Roseobacter sinensis TaxID=2931391 RepID=A0ABT3BLI5_9RHOB|nr:S-adenosylmethionine decarboxylase [Roseobacter sp. WL0113]MCV3274440.1 S-adenosylmethionine decarboxylase [Roseobacter sp. WL0113]